MLFRNGIARKMAVNVTVGESFDFGQPVQIFRYGRLGGAPVRIYDVDAAGNVLLLTSPPFVVQRVTRLNVVTNWFEELKQRVPTGGSQ